MDDFKTRFFDNSSDSDEDEDSSDEDSDKSSEHDKKLLRNALGKDDTPDADISNMGGDAALMHLIEQIDD